MQVFNVVQTVLTVITQTLAKNDRVELREFGVFEAVIRKAKIGRNPKKPDIEVQIPRRALVKLARPGKLWREKVLELPAKKSKMEVVTLRRNNVESPLHPHLLTVNEDIAAQKRTCIWGLSFVENPAKAQIHVTMRPVQFTGDGVICQASCSMGLHLPHNCAIGCKEVRWRGGVIYKIAKIYTGHEGIAIAASQWGCAMLAKIRL